MSSKTATASPDWTAIVYGVRKGHPAAMAELYRSLRGIQWYLFRQIGPNAEDEYQTLMTDLVIQIQRGEPRNPEAMFAYARTMASRRVANYLKSRSRQTDADITTYAVRDTSLNPEDKAIWNQQIQIAGQILSSLPDAERDILIRFYLDGDSAERIQEEMGLSETQFRLLKSRTKARFTDLCRKRFSNRWAQIGDRTISRSLAPGNQQPMGWRK